MTKAPAKTARKNTVQVAPSTSVPEPVPEVAIEATAILEGAPPLVAPVAPSAAPSVVMPTIHPALQQMHSGTIETETATASPAGHKRPRGVREVLARLRNLCELRRRQDGHAAWWWTGITGC